IALDYGSAETLHEDAVRISRNHVAGGGCGAANLGVGSEDVNSYKLEAPARWDGRAGRVGADHIARQGVFRGGGIVDQHAIAVVVRDDIARKEVRVRPVLDKDAGVAVSQGRVPRRIGADHVFGKGDSGGAGIGNIDADVCIAGDGVAGEGSVFDAV